MTGDGTSERGSQPPRTLFSLGREGSKRRRGGTDVAEDEPNATAPAFCGKCGEPLVGGAFCGECGAPVAAGSTDDADLGATDLIDEDLALDEVPDLIDEDLELEEDVDAVQPVDAVATDEVVEAAAEEQPEPTSAPVPAARPRGRKAKKRDKRARAAKAKAAGAAGAAAGGAAVVEAGAEPAEAEAAAPEMVETADTATAETGTPEAEAVGQETVDAEAADVVEADSTDEVGDTSSEVAETDAEAEAATGEATEADDADTKSADDATEVVAPSADADADAETEAAAATPLAVLAAGDAAPETSDATTAERDGKAKRSSVGWIVAGVAAAIIVIGGIVLLATRGGNDRDDVASGSDAVTARRESTTTTSSSSSTTTSTQPTTTSTAAETTTTEAPTSTQAPVTTVINVGPAPEGPKSPAALRVAGITCPLGGNPCTISAGGTLTVTLVNDGGSAGSYSVGGPGLQGPNGALSGQSSVSVTVRDTVGASDRLAPLTINGAGGLSLTVNVLVK